MSVCLSQNFEWKFKKETSFEKPEHQSIRTEAPTLPDCRSNSGGEDKDGGLTEWTGWGEIQSTEAIDWLGWRGQARKWLDQSNDVSIESDSVGNYKLDD